MRVKTRIALESARRHPRWAHAAKLREKPAIIACGRVAGNASGPAKQLKPCGDATTAVHISSQAATKNEAACACPTCASVLFDPQTHRVPGTAEEAGFLHRLQRHQRHFGQRLAAFTGADVAGSTLTAKLPAKSIVVLELQ